ncbi:unnamed protein product [Clonostachys rosea]|uniref:Uncharacterized protein n=1 Tax=Bionectria ochroleuca TaxID=29856 RepID=A0ABY6TVT2_BIOOC|nr:unnamed protein product [Clonostachys rosea]
MIQQQPRPFSSLPGANGINCNYTFSDINTDITVQTMHPFKPIFPAASQELQQRYTSHTESDRASSATQVCVNPILHGLGKKKDQLFDGTQKASRSVGVTRRNGPGQAVGINVMNEEELNRLPPLQMFDTNSYTEAILAEDLVSNMTAAIGRGDTRAIWWSRP